MKKAHLLADTHEDTTLDNLLTHDINQFSLTKIMSKKFLISLGQFLATYFTPIRGYFYLRIFLSMDIFIRGYFYTYPRIFLSADIFICGYFCNKIKNLKIECNISALKAYSILSNNFITYI